MEGVLFKKGQDIVGLWRERYFKEQNGRIYYYKSRRAPQPLGFIEIGNILSVEHVQDNYNRQGQYGFRIHLVGKQQREYNLCAPTQTERLNWINGINSRLLGEGNKNVQDKDRWKRSLEVSARSAVITIINQTNFSFRRKNMELLGPGQKWAFFPPEKIPPHASIEFGSQSEGMCNSTKASVLYEMLDDQETPKPGDFLFMWDNPLQRITTVKQVCCDSPPPYTILVDADMTSPPVTKFIADIWLVSCTISCTPDVPPPPPLPKGDRRNSILARDIIRKQRKDTETEKAKAAAKASLKKDWITKLEQAKLSFFIKIVNHTEKDLIRTETQLFHGNWASPPPEKIKTLDSGIFGTEDSAVVGRILGKALYILHKNNNSTSSEGNDTILTFEWDHTGSTVNAYSGVSALATRDTVTLVRENTKKGDHAEVVYHVVEGNRETVENEGEESLFTAALLSTPSSPPRPAIRHSRSDSDSSTGIDSGSLSDLTSESASETPEGSLVQKTFPGRMELLRMRTATATIPGGKADSPGSRTGVTTAASGSPPTTESVRMRAVTVTGVRGTRDMAGTAPSDVTPEVPKGPIFPPRILRAQETGTCISRTEEYKSRRQMLGAGLRNSIAQIEFRFDNVSYDLIEYYKDLNEATFGFTTKDEPGIDKSAIDRATYCVICSKPLIKQSFFSSETNVKICRMCGKIVCEECSIVFAFESKYYHRLVQFENIPEGITSCVLCSVSINQMQFHAFIKESKIQAQKHPLVVTHNAFKEATRKFQETVATILMRERAKSLHETWPELELKLINHVGEMNTFLNKMKEILKSGKLDCALDKKIVSTDLEKAQKMVEDANNLIKRPPKRKL